MRRNPNISQHDVISGYLWNGEFDSKEVCLLVAENNLDAVGRLVVSGQVSENEQLVTY